MSCTIKLILIGEEVQLWEENWEGRYFYCLFGEKQVGKEGECSFILLSPSKNVPSSTGQTQWRSIENDEKTMMTKVIK